MKQSIQNATAEAVRILKSATCPSLSGRSKLSYEFGCMDGSHVQLRITANTSAGSFSRDWIDLQTIGSVMENAPRGTPITSNALSPLFRGKSVNNQLFLFAILVHEGFVRRFDGEKRGYERVEVGEFGKRTRALIAGKGEIVGAATQKKPDRLKLVTKSKKQAASAKSKKSPS